MVTMTVVEPKAPLENCTRLQVLVSDEAPANDPPVFAVICPFAAIVSLAAITLSAKRTRVPAAVFVEAACGFDTPSLMICPADCVEAAGVAVESASRTLTPLAVDADVIEMIELPPAVTIVPTGPR